jgi:hypothetical protein
MLGYIAMKDAPLVMRNHKKAVEHTECGRWHGEEIHGRDGFTMIAQKSCPSLSRLRNPRRFPHPAQHCALRNLEAQHLQFAVDARHALGNHLKTGHTLSLQNRPTG